MIVFDNFMRNALESSANFAGVQDCSHFLSFAASLDGSLKELLASRAGKRYHLWIAKSI
jgi:hypothetical protein